MEAKGINFWVKVALFNLVVVALLGVLLRYKIAFSWPWIQQKHLLHGHSHFAFAAWVGQMIMTLIGFSLNERNQQQVSFQFKSLLFWNSLVAFFMLFAFVYQGYGFISIFFSTWSTAINYVFCWRVWRNLNQNKSLTTGDYYIKASIIFNVLSSLGTMYLGYLMSNKINHAEMYLASVYYYLHFQYNGYFIFSCLGLFTYFLEAHQLQVPREKIVFYLMAASLAPAYLLSIIWAKLPLYMYLILVLAAFTQLSAWFYWLLQIFRQSAFIKPHVSALNTFLWILVALAASLKFSLQGLSVLPSLSEYAFGFRPVVIAYLHLVLLGVVTLFLLGYALNKGYIVLNNWLPIGLFIFILGILLNELILMLQGMSFLNLVQIPFSNQLLFGVALIMMSGTMVLFCSQNKPRASLK